MALQDQTIPISFGKGVDTKTDPKQVIAGKMISLQNAVFQTAGSFRKRNGYGVVPMGLSAGNAIASYNNELVAIDGQNLYSYSANQQTGNNKGKLLSTGVSLTSIVRTTTQQTLPDSAYQAASNLYVYVWNDSAATGAKYSVVDGVTGQSIVTMQTISSSAYNPKVAVVGNFFVIAYVNQSSSKLCFKYIRVTTPTVLSSEVALNTYTGTGISFDILASGGSLYLVQGVSNTQVTSYYIASSGATPPAVTTTVTQGGFTKVLLVSAFTDASNNVWVGLVDTVSAFTQKVFAMAYAPLLVSQTLSPHDLEDFTTNSTFIISTITGAVIGTTATVYYSVVNYDSTTDTTVALEPFNNYIRKNTVTLAGAVGSSSDFLRSVSLATKAFLQNGVIYVGVIFSSTEQATYFVVDQNTNVASKMVPGNAGSFYQLAASTSASPLLNQGALPGINTLSSGVFQFPILQKDLVSSLEGVVYTQTGVSSISLTFNQSLVSLDQGNNLNVSGGFLSVYDGANVVEQNFHLFPENLTSTLSLVGGGLSPGSYQYSAVYEWTDNQGQIQKSAPSTPVTIDVASVPFTRDATVTNLDAITFSGTLPTPFLDGALLTGNANLAANTYIFANEGPYLFTPNATGNFANQSVSVQPALSLTLNTTNGSDQVTVTNQILFLVKYANNITFPTAGTGFTFTALNATGVRPGMNIFLRTPDGTSFNGYVTAVSGNSITMHVTVSAAAGTFAPFVTIDFSVSLVATATAGSPNLTAVSFVDPLNNVIVGIPLTSGIFLNEQVDDLNATFVPRGTQISLIGTNTLTMTNNSSLTGTIPVQLFTNYATAMMEVGQTLVAPSALGIPASATVKALSSNPTLFTLSAAATSTQTGLYAYTLDVSTINVNIPTLKITAKKGSISPPSIVLYRTIANGTVFYRVTSFTAPLLNDPTVDYKAFTDTIPDSLITGNEILYTTGGEVENEAIPASNLFTSYKNRMIAIPSEDPLSWWFSKQVIAGFPVEFSAFFAKRVSEFDGPITAATQLDDKLIFFKKNSLYYVAGDGPAPNGTNDDFTEAQLITSDTGCINAKSMVTIPSGVMYQSTKGIYLLERSLQATYIGAEVEAYNTQTITSAKLIEGVNQVRFTLASGVILVYDYFFSQWSVFTNLNAADSTIFQDLFTFIAPNGSVFQETIGVFNDNSAFIPLGLTMSWLSFAGLQGYERAREVLLLGDYESPHTLTATINYDFATTNTQTVSIPVLSPPTGPYQYRIFLQQQKCEAFQLSLLESQAGPTYGEGLRLSALSVEVGMKKGPRKVASAVSYG